MEIKEIIKINNLTKYYGKSRGVENISLTINEGEMFGFIGPNGAGKSTTIRTLLGFLKPTKGSASIFGLDVVKDSQRIKSQIGYLPSEVNFYGEMTVKQLLDYSSRFYKNSDEKFKKELIELFEVDTTKKMGALSLGNKKKVGIIQCVLHRPKLIILDEPTSGLDPLMQNKFFEVITKLNENGTTVFFSSHVLSEVQKYCHRVAIIREGKIIKTENVDEVKEKSMKIITVKFRDGGKDIADKINAFKVEEQMGHYKLYVKGDINKTLRELAGHTVEDITIEEPTLEETFMQYYV